MTLQRRPAGGWGIRPEVLRLHEKAPAANDAIRTIRGTLRVLLRRHRIISAAVPILAPLHDIACHVVGAVWGSVAVGRQVSTFAAIVVADRLPGVVVLGVDIVGIGMIDGIAPWEAALVRAARGLFPFGFRGQTILLTGLRAQPIAIGGCRIPIDT
jgi:hypothetical protein